MRFIDKPQISLNPKKSRKPLQDEFSSLLLSNQKEILKRGMTWTEQKLKGTTFKVQSIAIANPLYIDFIHQWNHEEDGRTNRQSCVQYKLAVRILAILASLPHHSVPSVHWSTLTQCGHPAMWRLQCPTVSLLPQGQDTSVPRAHLYRALVSQGHTSRIPAQPPQVSIPPSAPLCTRGLISRFGGGGGWKVGALPGTAVLEEHQKEFNYKAGITLDEGLTQHFSPW